VVAKHRHLGVFGFGENPFGFHGEVGPVVALALGANAGIVFIFAGQGAGSAADALVQINRHSIFF
jgi:hypothetical protein